MPHSYNIVRRRDLKTTRATEIDFDDRQREYPLCGCANYKEDIQVGDIVGIKLAEKRKSRERVVSGRIDFDLETILPQGMIPVKILRYHQIEEHLFVIKQIVNSHTFRVNKHLLDGNQVLVKEILLESTSQIKVSLKQLTPYQICCLYYYKLYRDYGRFEESEHRVCNENECKFYCFNYETTMFDFENNDLNIRAFYQYLIDHKDKVIEMIAKKNAEKVYNQLGTYDLAKLNMDVLYQNAIKILEKEIVIDVKYNDRIEFGLAEPVISHNIKTINYADIFRVYKTDPDYVLAKTTHVTNWNGRLLDEIVRQHVSEGNVVRVAFRRKDTGKYGNGSWVIYCKLIKKLSETRFLAAITNMYFSEYEDIVVVIDVGAITEIPLTWTNNYMSFEHLNDIEKETGFAITGSGALGTSGEVYPLTYDQSV